MQIILCDEPHLAPNIGPTARWDWEMGKKIRNQELVHGRESQLSNRHLRCVPFCEVPLRNLQKPIGTNCPFNIHI